MSNIKELIRAEIRKWQSNIEAKCPESTRSRNYTKEEWNAIYEYNAYTRILSFIDTLPDEPVTDCHDLTEAAIDFADDARKALYSKDYAISSIADYDHGCIDGFKAGAKWGANHLRDTTKKVSEDLGEAADEYIAPIENDAGLEFINFSGKDIKDAFIAGAEWQYQKDRGEFAKIKAKTWCEGFDAHKEQILKEAVEADVNIYRDLAEGKSWAEFVVEMPTNNLGDKVKIIIVKEDGE